MSKIKYRQFLTELKEKIGYSPSHSQLSEILNNEVTANALSNRYSMDGYIKIYEAQKIIDFYNNQEKNIDNDIISIPYIDWLPEELKNPKYPDVVSRSISIDDWGDLNSLRIVAMNGDKMECFWYRIRNKDVLIVDTSETKVNVDGAGVYFATSRNRTQYWIREMTETLDGGIEIKAYPPSGEITKVFTKQQLIDADFEIIGRVVKNASLKI